MHRQSLTKTQSKRSLFIIGLFALVAYTVSMMLFSYIQKERIAQSLEKTRSHLKSEIKNHTAQASLHQRMQEFYSLWHYIAPPSIAPYASLFIFELKHKDHFDRGFQIIKGKISPVVAKPLPGELISSIQKDLTQGHYTGKKEENNNLLSQRPPQKRLGGAHNPIRSQQSQWIYYLIQDFTTNNPQNSKAYAYIFRFAEHLPLLIPRQGLLYIPLVVILTGAVLFIFYFGYVRRVAKALQRLNQEAQKISNNEVKFFYPQEKLNELYDLEQSINNISRNNLEQINKSEEQKKEYQLLLANMVEGVIALDDQDRIVMINKSAINILSLEPNSYRGVDVYTIIRSPSAVNFIKKAKTSNRFPIEDYVSFYLLTQQNTPSPPQETDLFQEKYIRIQASKLEPLNRSQNPGLLLMLYDYTQLHYLENVQKEFVANVSHELKTPITTIQGFVETLQRGALHNPENAQHFLSIINKNTTRLNQIIEDLLLLSRIEEQSDLNELNEPSQLVTEPVSIKDIIESSIKNCSPKTKENEFELISHCPSDLTIKGNPTLLEHAITNLIDNAIKYSYPSKKVEIHAEAYDEKLLIHVKDWGQGIPDKDQERLFERFYRVDKNKSRSFGGTGLGLSITQQIAHIHGGRVQVQSEVGKGSTFTIELPKVG